ncbi:glycosyltransferase [Paenarthrobacter sp. 22069]|uniref:glycosyltransferase n=1 Tax=Paenarthrobacter sp. 22069 TaxID=3453864 RepID=UPI003F861F0E
MLNAGFSDLKNVKLALEAWSKIRDSFPEAILAVAGPGYEPGGEAQRWAAQNSFEAQVEFLGGLAPEAVPQFFGSLDAFLHPSLEESFGMVLIEAMACGVPVIAGKSSGAVPEVTGGNAVLTNVNSVDSIAASLRATLSDSSLRRKLSVDGKLWSRRFELQSVAELYVAQLSKLLA